MVKPAADAGQNAVQQSDQRNKRQQHCADVERQLHTRRGAGGGGVQHVGRFIRIRALAVMSWVIVRFLRFRYDNFGKQQSTRRRHKRRGNQVLQRNAHLRIARQHGTRHRGQAAAHDRKQLRAGHGGDIRTHHQRRFGLTNEDVRRGRQRLGTRGLQNRPQRAAENANDQLHNAQVVKHGNQRREEDDHRQHAQGKDEAAAAKHLEHFIGDQPAEDETNPFIAVGNNAGDAIRHR